MFGKKTHALHSWTLRLVCNQTYPLVMKLMTDFEDKTDRFHVFKNSWTSHQEWAVGWVPVFLFVRGGFRSHSYQRCSRALPTWINLRRFLPVIGKRISQARALAFSRKVNFGDDYKLGFWFYLHRAPVISMHYMYYVLSNLFTPTISDVHTFLFNL